MNITQVITRLKEGNERYVSDKPVRELQNVTRRKELAEGQKPWAIVLSCADSRVVPELAFDTGLGEVFVVRVAGNIANTSSIASIEYAVANLNAKVIVVLGHENCGAVTAAIKGGDYGYNLNHLLAHLSSSVSAADQNASVNEVVKKNVKHTVSELMSRSSTIANAIKKNDLKIVPAYYHLTNGKVDFL